jgi:hypothetical protein
MIRRSAADEIRQLVAALGGEDELRREAAIARLRVIGARAVDRLTAAYETAADRDTKIAILRAIETAVDVRALTLARKASQEGGDVSVAAAAALRALLDSPDAATASLALDTLVAMALENGGARRVQLAAFEALRDVPGEIRPRLAGVLGADPSRSFPQAILDAPRDAAAAHAVWHDVLDGRLPDTASTLRDAAAAFAATTPLGSLQKAIDAVREKEVAARSAAKRADWRATRGALHQVLALRGSRIALYDLRETVEATREALPMPFLTALHIVGDVSCLEAVAAAHAAADDPRWQQQLLSVFRAISRREKIARRHAVMKRVAARWPGLVAALSWLVIVDLLA